MADCDADVSDRVPKWATSIIFFTGCMTLGVIFGITAIVLLALLFGDNPSRWLVCMRKLVSEFQTLLGALVAIAVAFLTIQRMNGQIRAAEQAAGIAREQASAAQAQAEISRSQFQHTVDQSQLARKLQAASLRAQATHTLSRIARKCSLNRQELLDTDTASTASRPVIHTKWADVGELRPYVRILADWVAVEDDAVQAVIIRLIQELQILDSRANPEDTDAGRIIDLRHVAESVLYCETLAIELLQYARNPSQVSISATKVRETFKKKHRNFFASAKFNKISVAATREKDAAAS